MINFYHPEKEQVSPHPTKGDDDDENDDDKGNKGKEVIALTLAAQTLKLG